MSVEELEQAVADLSPGEFARFSAWFDRYGQSGQDDDAWDRHIEADVKAGKLDWLAEEVEEDIAAGRTCPL